MVAKRKAVSVVASSLKTTSSALKDRADEDMDTETQIVPVQENKEVTEKELVIARAKELKSMPAEDLKQLLLKSGLETGKKEAMIATLLKHEAKARKADQETKAKIRAVVVQKKQELEGKSIAELNKLCEAMGIKGRSKGERVQQLLVQWQENDGVDKALAQIAADERKQELDAMDETQLRKLCNKFGVDPFVKEIMVDRISKRESETGCYSRPSIVQEGEAPNDEMKGDMVEALLANEAQRQKERELRCQQEDAAAQKIKELKSMSIDDLKKRLKKKNLEETGKKEEMVLALFKLGVQEDAVKARTSELKSKSLQELKELLARQGLEAGSKERMIQTMLEHEAKRREDLKAFEAKLGEVAAQKKEELGSKTNAELKELCETKGLAVGGGKEERIERILDKVQEDGEFDKVVTKVIRGIRKEELMSMDKSVVVQLCEKLGVDAVVKAIMVERIISYEGEGGADEPAAKKARLSKK